MGGISMVSGTVIAGLWSTEGFFPHLLERWFGLKGTWALFVGGVSLVVTLVANPDGIAGANYRRKQLKRGQRSLPSPSPTEPVGAAHGQAAVPAARSATGADALTRVGLGDLVDVRPSDLSQGQRKLTGVARALAAGPRVVLLDEPAAGLDTVESRRLGERLRAVADSGTAMLLVDHDMGLVLGVCDHVVVLEFGKVISAGTPDQVRRDPAVIRAYLGGSANTTAAADPAEAVGR
jgi:Branched-chain amino acid ATP-binding cassette transporter/ABC transporter